MTHSRRFAGNHILYVLCVIFGNMAINSFFTMFLIEYFPTLGCLYRGCICSTEQITLQFCGFSALLCFYLMLLYVADYGVLLLIFSLGLLFQFSAKSFTVCNFWSVDTLLVVSFIYEYILVDLFNIFLLIPGNLLCFFHSFQPYMIQVFVKDWHGKSHLFHLVQTATLSDLKKQVSVKFKIPHSMFWLSGPGADNKTEYNTLPNLATFQMRGRLFGANDECCIKGCTGTASNRKITCLTGVYELKLSPDLLRQANDPSNNICNRHYYLHTKRGHKPKRPHSRTKDTGTPQGVDEDEIWLAGLDIKKCSSCAKRIIVTKSTPCPQHILTIESKSYMCACNCLDEKSTGKGQENNREIYVTNGEMYHCIPNCEDQLLTNSDLEQNYICTECGPAYIKSLKPGGSSPENEETKNSGFQECLQLQCIRFPFSEHFKELKYTTSQYNTPMLNSYEAISDIFLSISKMEFPPWEVYLQNSKTGVMLHFQLGCREGILSIRSQGHSL